MNKFILLLFSVFFISLSSFAQNNKGYSYATGVPNSSTYPIKTIIVEDDWSKDMSPLSNGKCYPILNRVIRNKGEYIGGTLENMTTGKKTSIIEITLSPSGAEDGLFKVSGTGFSMSMKPSKGAIANLGDNVMIFWDGKDYWKVTKKV